MKIKSVNLNCKTMKVRLQLTMLVLLAGLMTRAQIAGTFDIPGTYPTIASAIAALNVAGVGPGGVTFNVAAGHAETLPTLQAGYITFGNGTADNPIIFQKSGTGANPVITAAAGGTSLYWDAIICLKGTSYVTFDGIDLLENPLNLDAVTQTEWGYAVLKASGTQGSHHNTIKNCSISLSSADNRSWGVYLNNLTPESITQLTVTSYSGTSSFNTFSGLTISNTYHGIRLQGYADANNVLFTDFYDKGNTATGNTITLSGAGAPAASASTYGFYIFYNTDLVVSNNSITGTVAATSSAPTGIQIGQAVNGSCEVSYNTVSLSYLGNSGNMAGISATEMGVSCTNGITSYHHNIVTNCSYPKATSGSFVGITCGNGYSFSVFNNSVTNITYGDGTTTATGEIRGLFVYQVPQPPLSGQGAVYNNLVSGITRAQSTPGNHFNYLVYVQQGGTNYSNTLLWDIYNNTVEDNNSNSTGSMDCFSLDVRVGIKFHDNIIRNNRGGGNVNGIWPRLDVPFGWTTPDYFIYNNQVYGLTTTSATSTHNVSGLQDNIGRNPVYWYNNFVSDLKAPNSTNPNAVIGINLSQSTTGSNYNYLYNNTVHLDATSTSATNFGTSGISVLASKYTELKNNIIVNASAHIGTGKTVALRYSAPISSINYTAGSNNNLFYAGTPGPDNLIHHDGTNSDQTLAAFQARVAPRDNSSVTELPPFVNVAVKPCDLHLGTETPTQCESGGTLAATPLGPVSRDYDDQARYPNPGYPVHPVYPATASDIGADEFGGIPADVNPPGIGFTPLANTSSLAPCTLTATIADPSGVPTSGTGLPRLYWKINQGGSWNTSIATWISGSTYTFSLGTSAVLGDSVYYYIVAQDLVSTPNAGSNPAVAGCTANPPACATPPANSVCYAYKIVGALCGIYTIGAAQTYPTLTAAIADLSVKHITCPVELHLSNDYNSSAETFPIVFGTYNGASATNTVTIRPAPDVNAVISGASTTSIIKLSRARYIIIDGSNNGTASRNLTISNTATTGTTAAVWIASQGTALGSTNDVVKNCKISNGYRTATSYGVFIGSNTTLGSAGDDNDNLTLSNNEISMAYIGISAIASAAGINDNLVIAANILGSDIAASYLAFKGIYLSYAIGAQVTGNEIYNLIGTGGKTGIELNSNLLNTMISGNKIHDLKIDAGSFGGSIGINAGLSANPDVINTTLVNNLIYNLTTTHASATDKSFNPFGIKLARGTGYKLYNNTVRMTGTQLQWNTSTPGTLSSALLIMNSTVDDMRNNILSNNLVGLTGSKSYCIYMDGSSSIITASNYNDFWPSGAFGILGRYYGNNVGTDVTTLATWQSLSGKDANSVSADPLFTAADNQKPANYDISKKGNAVADVTTDFAQVIRTSPPDIGAYEFGVVATTAAATGITTGGATLNGSALSNSMAVTTYFDYGTTTSYGQTIAATPATVSGTAAQAVSAVVSGLQFATTYHFRVRVVTPGNADVNGQDLTFTTELPENTTVQNVTVASGQDTCFNATNTVTIAGNGNSFVVQNGGSATMVAGQAILYLPGTIVEAGGYMLGYITENGQYCGTQPAAPLVAASVAGPGPLVSEKPAFRIYPNPTTGSFTLEIPGDGRLQGAAARIYDIRGNNVLDIRLGGQNKEVISLENQPEGLYFIRLVSGEASETGKIIKE